jgi:hypothetical protein
MSEGRSAWTIRGKGVPVSFYTRRKGAPLDGQIPDYTGGMDQEAVLWYTCVNYGVKAIAKAVGDTWDDGLYRWSTKKAVKKFQESNGLYADGEVGQETMRAILTPIIKRECQKRNIDPQWIYALAKQESALDPGAQGATTPNDLGIWQFNTSSGAVSPENAFDIDWAAEAVCARFKACLHRYSGQGPQMRLDCSIMQHRSPYSADYYFETGELNTPESMEYVDKVKMMASDW